MHYSLNSIREYLSPMIFLLQNNNYTHYYFELVLRLTLAEDLGMGPSIRWLKTTYYSSSRESEILIVSTGMCI